MNHKPSFFEKHKFISVNILVILASFFSFRYVPERILFPFTGMGWAYLVDQLIPFFIALITSIYFLKQHTSLYNLNSRLKKHYLFLCLIFIIALVVHLGILYYFFWAEEVNFILKPITQNKPFQFHLLGSSNMRGYFATSYTFLYLVFGTKAWIFPMFSIIYFAISNLFVYWFILLLTNKKTIAALAAFFFATTPAFLDMFTFHTTAHAPTLALGLASFISLLYYRRYYNMKRSFYFYVLSIMFFFAAIKIGFIRSASYTLIPPLLLLIPLRNKSMIKPLSAFIHWLPFILISFLFVILEFMHTELLNLFHDAIKSGNLSLVIDFIAGYRGIDSSLLPAKFLFFFTYLFIPSGLVAEMLPFFRSNFPQISLALSLGIIILFGILLTLTISFKKHKKVRWLVSFALLFAILNMLHNAIGYQAPNLFNPETSHFAELIDREFSQESAGYGPGSRYIFSSTVGVSLLFALFIYWIANKGKKFTFLAVILFSFVIGGNSYFTIRAQIKNFDGMYKYRSLVGHIFKMVPRDGKPKLLFSQDREQNSLERKFGGWQWLYGFYKEDELYYSKDITEIQKLISEKKYIRENLYGFYQNPDTLTFTDISEEARNYFYPDGEIIQKEIPLVFPDSIKQTLKGFEAADKTNFLERAILESQEINLRKIPPLQLKFKMNFKQFENTAFPFADVVIIEDTKYSYSFPFELWQRVASPPKVTKKEEVKNKNSSLNLSASDITQVLQIQKDRENLITGSKINIESSAGKETNLFETEKDAGKLKSLIDGFYVTYPRPQEDENYFVSDTSPVTITIQFPYKTNISRILLNTPVNYSSMSPKSILVSISSDGEHFNKAVELENPPPLNWSPNKGIMHAIDLNSKVEISAIRLTITGKTKTIALDELVLDNESALKFSPQKIYETSQNFFHYVENKGILDKLTSLKKYNQLTIIWACAEDIDWQKQLKNKKDLIPKIWYLTKVSITPRSSYIEDKVTLNCYGAKLKKLFFVSPPYPVEMKLLSAVIE